jgi:hypothetical protein
MQYEDLHDIMQRLKVPVIGALADVYSATRVKNKQKRMLLREFQHGLRKLAISLTEDGDRLKVVEVAESLDLPERIVGDCLKESARRVYCHPYVMFHNMNKVELKRNALELDRLVAGAIKTVLRQWIEESHHESDGEESSESDSVSEESGGDTSNPIATFPITTDHVATDPADPITSDPITSDPTDIVATDSADPITSDPTYIVATDPTDLDATDPTPTDSIIASITIDPITDINCTDACNDMENAGLLPKLEPEPDNPLTPRSQEVDEQDLKIVYVCEEAPKRSQNISADNESSSEIASDEADGCSDDDNNTFF